MAASSSCVRYSMESIHIRETIWCSTLKIPSYGLSPKKYISEDAVHFSHSISNGMPYISV